MDRDSYSYFYFSYFLFSFLCPLKGGDVAQEVRAVVWQSEGCRFDPTLGVSKCPWARHLTPNCSWRAGWYLAWQPIAVGVWMRGRNSTARWIKALYECSPFTILPFKSTRCFTNHRKALPPYVPAVSARRGAAGDSGTNETISIQVPPPHKIQF